MMMAKKIVVVTGANRGIGQAICREMLQSQGPIKLYACSRSGTDLGFSSSSSEIQYSKLDITQSSQIQSLVSEVKSTDGHVDILINNAGLNTDSAINNPTIEDTKSVMGINYFGTKDMCLSFLPLMNTNSNTKPRIVNLSSTASSIKSYSRAFQSYLRSSDLTLSEIDLLASEYISMYTSGSTNNKFASDLESATPYPLSKALINAMTMNLARENADVLINACCPGWVSTDMGRIVGDAPKSVEDGAKIPVRLAFGNIDGVSGRYWSNDSVFATGDGKVVQW